MTADEQQSLRERVTSLERMVYGLRQELASLVGVEERPSGAFDYLACRLGALDVGIRLEHVEEVVPIPLLAPLPEAPPWVSGLLNLRGESIPVIDGLARVERRPREAALSDLVAVCSIGSQRFGLVVQEVFEVVRGDGSKIASPGDIPHAPYLLGVIETQSRTIELLSLERLMKLSDVPEIDA